jgi:hypothetical protein
VRFERLVVALLVRGDMLGSFAAGVEAGGRSSQLVEWSRRRVGEAELPSYFVRVVSLLFAPLSLVLRRLASSIYGGMRPTAIGVAESHAPIEGMPLREGCPYWRDASSIYGGMRLAAIGVAEREPCPYWRDASSVCDERIEGDRRVEGLLCRCRRLFLSYRPSGRSVWGSASEASRTFRKNGPWVRFCLGWVSARHSGGLPTRAEGPLAVRLSCVSCTSRLLYNLFLFVGIHCVETT